MQPLELSGRNSSFGVASVVSFEVSAKGETGFTLPLLGVGKYKKEMHRMMSGYKNVTVVTP